MLHVSDISVVGEARNANEAVEQTIKLRPDVVLMDLGLPGLTGIDAMRAIMQRVPSVAVVILTGSDEHDRAKEALFAGARGYLLKGSDRSLLEGAVRAAHAGNSIIDSSILDALRSQSEDSKRPDGSLKLSPRELQILEHLVNGLTNKEMSQRLQISEGTVKNRIQRIMEKLGVSDRTQAAVFAVRNDLIQGSKG